MFFLNLIVNLLYIDNFSIKLKLDVRYPWDANPWRPLEISMPLKAQPLRRGSPPGALDCHVKDVMVPLVALGCLLCSERLDLDAIAVQLTTLQRCKSANLPAYATYGCLITMCNFG